MTIHSPPRVTRFAVGLRVTTQAPIKTPMPSGGNIQPHENAPPQVHKERVTRHGTIAATKSQTGPRSLTLSSLTGIAFKRPIF